MNNLPKNWKIKNTGNSDFDIVLQYLNKVYRRNNKYWLGKSPNTYYGVYENRDFCSNTYEDMCKTLSIEEFIHLSKEIEEFPKKWCIFPQNEKELNIILNWANTTCKKEYNNFKWHPQVSFDYNGNYRNYEEKIITFKQFEENILKQTSMETNKEINYYEILQNVWGLEGIKWGIGKKLYATNKDSLPYFEKLGILKDTTIFRPVYKEEEFKVGDIVLLSNNAHGWGATVKEIDNKVLKITKIDQQDRKSEGGRYYFGNNIRTVGQEIVRIASPEEIKEYENNLLLEEAKLKYPKGTKFKGFGYGNEEISTGNFKIDYGTQKGKEVPIVQVKETSKGIYNVLGEWAEILPSYPQITINTYTGEFFETYVKFGCAEISKEVFIDLHTAREYKNTNRDVESVTIGKGIFSKEQIKEIAEYYLEKK